MQNNVILRERLDRRIPPQGGETLRGVYPELVEGLRVTAEL
jgi:hypothetical protein